MNMKLPQRVFYTGVPGSSWSVVAQLIEQHPDFNTSDRRPDRSYIHESGASHLGAYFGDGMEFPVDLSPDNIDAPWDSSKGCRLIKSHEWAHCLDDIHDCYPDAWIMLLYRPDLTSFAWWQRAGGGSITYPCYDAYHDPIEALSKTLKQNQDILNFSKKYDLTWRHFSTAWVEENFGHCVDYRNLLPNDLLVTILK